MKLCFDHAVPEITDGINFYDLSFFAFLLVDSSSIPYECSSSGESSPSRPNLIIAFFIYDLVLFFPFQGQAVLDEFPMCGIIGGLHAFL